MLSVPGVHEDTSSSDLSDVPPSLSNDDVIPPTSSQPRAGYELKEPFETNKTQLDTESNTATAYLPQLTPATAEVLARINGQADTATNLGAEVMKEATPLVQDQREQNSSQASANVFKGPRIPDRASMMTTFSSLAPKAVPHQSHATSNMMAQSGTSSKIMFDSSPFGGSKADGPSTVPRLNLKVSHPSNGTNGHSNGMDKSSIVIPATASATPSFSATPDSQANLPGKGLGKGRPGIKRGPRSAGKKRKRGDESDDDNIKGPPSDESDSDHYMPTETQTKSGRQVHRPETFVPPESPQSNKSNKVRPEPKLKKKYIPASAKGREQNILCEHCLRGNGPLGNAIVFCDGCNRAWHQKCHEPKITREVVMDTEKDWYCAECATSTTTTTKKKKGRPRKIRPEDVLPRASPAQQNGSAPPPPAQLFGAKDIKVSDQKKFLESLSREQLIERLLLVASQNPAMPLFPHPYASSPPPVPPKTSTVASTASSMAAPSSRLSVSVAADESVDDSDDDYIYDEHALLYPKAGQGIKLPPESEDLHMLLEGPECRTFSHSLRADVKPVANAFKTGRSSVGVFG